MKFLCVSQSTLANQHFLSKMAVVDTCLFIISFYLLISKEAGVALDVIGRWLLK
jgi:hypothetical protein